MSKLVDPEEIRETRLADALSERYLSYALSTIMSRSLPDVRDGLKPVHRRLLYAMRQLKLDPSSGTKSAPVLLVTSWVNITRMVTNRFTMRWCDCARVCSALSTRRRARELR